MQIDITGMDIPELIEAYYVMYYFNLLTGDIDYKYCEDEIARLDALEEYEACAGIIKAVNFKKYGGT